VFVAVSLTATFIRRMPLSTAIPYLLIGWAIGPHGFGLLHLDPIRDAATIQTLAEIAILISVFNAGLSLRAGWRNRIWRPVVRLAFVSMALTVILIALACVYLMHLSWGAALLVGGMLAPTDPVLASDVQLEHPYNPNPLRFALTGEAGLNDGATFPFVIFGLGLLGLPAGRTGLHWFGLDLLWGVVGGLAIGFVLGTLITKYVLHLRLHHGQALGLGYFLAPGLIALSYGIAGLSHVFGFLTVFAAGLAVRRVEFQQTRLDPDETLTEIAIAPSQRNQLASDPRKASIYLLQNLLTFSGQLEQLSEAVIVTLVGALFTMNTFATYLFWFLPLLFFGIRPLATKIGLLGCSFAKQDQLMVEWFGIRGIATIYYFSFLVMHSLPQQYTNLFLTLALWTIAISIVVHGVSVTPLMNYHDRHH
jgi:sodium/hydrogen antiporter